MIGWSEMKELSFSEDYKISAMEVSKNNPEHLFYYGASSDSNKPIIYKLPDGHTETTGAIDISIPNVAEGAYLHNITVNPNDGNEIILVFSNYNITGLFHSTDGGENYTAVEGNLTGDEQEPGPSLRGATILPTPEGGIYFVGTSVGLFSTDNLNGVNTEWIKEGEEKMGNVIVNYVTSRKSDGKVVAGSHGRGAFQTKVPGFGTPSVLVDSDQLHIDCLPDSSASCFFNISNSGVGELNYYITASGSFENSANSKKIFKNLMIGSKINRRSKNPSIKSTNVSGNRLMGSDVLILDDGDQTADDFIGYYNNTTYGAVNEYLLDETGFNLEEIRFYSRSENSLLNEFFVAVYDKDLNNLWSGYKSFDLAQNGAWFNIKLPNVIEFNSGSKFYIHLESNYSFIDNPYGFDQDAQVSGHSYYFDFLNENLINMNTISGYENGAFLIRAVGTLSSSINEEPVAIASVSNANPDVEEMVTFDASQSYDNDGQIVEYHWDFGDGKSAYTNISYHTYSNAGNYTYTLRVTDDDGASDQTSGEIIVTGLTPTQRFALSHSNGTLQAGQSQQVRLDFFSQDLSEGIYNGEVNITSNGGNKTIPLSIRVDKSVNVEEADDLPINFTLSQNYPNPFNPVTNIEFHIPQKGNVELKVYDITGREVVTLLNEEKTPGKYNVAFDGSALASGVYFYRIKTSEFAASKKCLLVK
jgi:PKD repeat protein